MLEALHGAAASEILPTPDSEGDMNEKGKGGEKESARARAKESLSMSHSQPPFCTVKRCHQVASGPLVS